MSTQYPILDNRPIDQWKVAELKEELKKRKLTTRGLKDDLIRRLNEAIRNEKEEEAIHNETNPEKEEAIRNEKDAEMEEEALHNETNAEKEETILSGKEVENEEATCNEKYIENEEESIHNEKADDKEDETICVGGHSAVVEDSNGSDCKPEPQVTAENVQLLENSEHVENKTVKLDDDVELVNIDDGLVNQVIGEVQDGEPVVRVDSVEAVKEPVVLANSTETNVMVSESLVTHIASSGQELQDTETKVGKEDPKPSHEDAVLKLSNPKNQVSEVSPDLGFQVTYDSISTDSASINEKNELKDNLNSDNFHIELDIVKPEMTHSSSSDVPYNGGDVHPLDDLKPCKDQDTVEETNETNSANMDLGKKNDSAVGGSPEKLNLDRSSGDDSMAEDVLESKHVGTHHNSGDLEGKNDLTGVHVVKEESPVLEISSPPERKDILAENKSTPAVLAEKRKHEDPEVVRSNEPPKRQRRWALEAIKVPEPQTSKLSPTTTPKDVLQSVIPKRNFTRSDSSLSSGEEPKERIVPPSPKPPTNSLRIDCFLRPFTLKAVQELLAKTGSVCSFWMDQIKTHCYVTYSSVQEAIETRSALYNLQWPSNGGRLLIAEFVDAQEVKMRAEAPPQSPATAVSNSSAAPSAPSQPQPSPRKHLPRQQLPPPPPPPLSYPPTARERLPLPPPPPLPKKPDPPIVTLDDLFRKTIATPRVYYLPLSEEQVAAKLAVQARNTKL